MDQEQASCLIDGTWRQRVVDDARSWKFTPYHHKGRVKGVGVDCGGLLYEVYGTYLGPFPPFPDTYPPDWSLHRDNEIYLDFIMPFVEEVHAPIAGGFSLFKYGRNFAHAAIYTHKRTYIHAYGRNNVGGVQESPPEFFKRGVSVARAVRHFDVSTSWLCSLRH